MRTIIAMLQKIYVYTKNRAFAKKLCSSSIPFDNIKITLFYIE